ncbi:MAG: hypothetical protein ACHQVS_02705 [Candidatus Babeliales bacterium]
MKYIIIFALSAPALLHPQQTETTPELQQKTEQLSANHYTSHLITGLAAHLVFLTSTVTGIIIGDAVAKTGTADWISYQIGLTPKELRCTNYNILFGVRAIPAALSMLAGLYVVYKTPQWTDKYLLKKKKERSVRQNILVFLNRFLLPCPIGILTGEYFTH